MDSPAGAASPELGRWRSPGWWLQLVGAAHGGVAAASYRDVYAEIARRGLLASVPDRGDRATAFWFAVGAPSMWIGGRLLRSAEATDDGPAQRAAGRVLLAVGLTGGALNPLSGFWALAAVGYASLKRASNIAPHASR